MTTTTLVTVFVLLVTAVAGTAAYVSAGYNVRTAVKLASTHQPETYTELYFLNPSKLPLYSAPGKQQTLHFVIKNDDALDTTYTYRVVAIGSEGTSVTSKNVVVAAGQSVTIPYSFTIPNPNEQLTITVSLVGTQEQLQLRSQS